MRTKKKLNKKQLLITVAVITFIGCVALAVNFALTPSSGGFEAETMTVEAL